MSEIAVTPLQLATAYATFANGGKLVEPALIKEVVGPDGSVRYRHTTHVVRQVVAKPVAVPVAPPADPPATIKSLALYVHALGGGEE